MFESHVGYIAGYVVVAGIIGLYSRMGPYNCALLVLVPRPLTSNPNFIHFEQAFQSWPAVLFLIVAYVLALARVAGNPALISSGPLRRRDLTLRSLQRPRISMPGSIPAYIELVSPPAARELAAVQRELPASVEVIASQGVIGRFGAGHIAFSYWALAHARDVPAYGNG